MRSSTIAWITALLVNLPAAAGLGSETDGADAPAAPLDHGSVSQSDIGDDAVRERLLNSDYFRYDRETLRALADNGDLIAINIASVHASAFSLAEREHYALLAARHGDHSGLLRMFMAYLPGEPGIVEAPESNSVKAYGYLFAAGHFAVRGANDADLQSFDSLSTSEQAQARRFSDALIADIGAANLE